MNARGIRHSRPLLGVAYLLALALLVGTSIAAYRKDLPWQATATVSLTTATAGLELNPHSTVKFGGAEVGEVRRITSDGFKARVELAIDPTRLELLPANVDAAIVPKTLFGEKYVDLRPPTHPSSRRLAAGDAIHQTQTSVEIGRLYSQLVPLLRALKPSELSVVLANLASALDGRGASLARVSNQLQKFLGEVNPHMDTLVHDVAQYARVNDLYADHADSFLDILNNSAAISRDQLIAHEKDFSNFLTGIVTSSDKTTEVLHTNSATIVQLSGRQRPVLALLDEYSTTLPCLIKGLYHIDSALMNASGARGPFANLGIDLIAQQRPYTYPQDLPGGRNDSNISRLPEWVPSWEPHCPQFAPWILNAGRPKPYSQPGPGTAVAPRTRSDASRSTQPSRGAATAPAPAAGHHTDLVQQARSALARALAAQRIGVSARQVPAFAELLVAPLLTDGKVEVQ